ncbi:hypothetical protein SKAU_G00215590 [Synaphobranchus kaupii]|uniref:Uncharacterized protein n=1 Tax=Synaphobranchus kaupii TaxID=118154 RepID=A0A9Q1FA06_SYNKA|nr:hypothetical protein SKAU_G00215590 [Synaphobranchus kaupii]
MAAGTPDVPSGATSWYCAFNHDTLYERENYLNEINRGERSAFLYNKMCCAGKTRCGQLCPWGVGHRKVWLSAHGPDHSI